MDVISEMKEALGGMKTEMATMVRDGADRPPLGASLCDRLLCQPKLRRRVPDSADADEQWATAALRRPRLVSSASNHLLSLTPAQLSCVIHELPPHLYRDDAEMTPR